MTTATQQVTTTQQVASRFHELAQQGNSSNMVHNFDNLVAYISNFFSVNIGDVIFTGTPAGVGEAVVGDEFEGFLEDVSMFTLDIK